MTEKLLSGIRVLDLSRTVAGPLAGQVLADFGAEVIRVERPGGGDDLRLLGPTHLLDKDGKPTQEGAMFLAVNRSKKGITADLAKPAAQDLIRKLAAKCDVLIENYKVGDMQRFGLDYARISVLHPGIIYCSVTGYGQSGPYASRPGYDAIFQAMGGWMSINGPSDEQPAMVSSNVVDAMAGYNAAMGILAALFRRDRNGGRGQYIDVGLLDVAIAGISQRVQDYFVTGVQPPRRDLSFMAYRCADGLVAINTANRTQWQAFCKVLGRPDIGADPRYLEFPGRMAHKKTLFPMLETITMTWQGADLLAAVEQAGVPGGPVYDIAQVFQDPQVRHRGMEIEVDHPLSGTLRLVANPIKFSATPITDYRAPPLVGQHTEEVLRSLLNLSEADIKRLRDERAI